MTSPLLAAIAIAVAAARCITASPMEDGSFCTTSLSPDVEARFSNLRPDRMRFQAPLLTPDASKSAACAGASRLTATAATANVASDADPNLFCETTPASPLGSDVLWTINQLELVGDRACRQVNPFKSTCTKMQTHRTAMLSICGRLHAGVKCWDAAQAAESVWEKCRWIDDGNEEGKREEKVGGLVVVGEGLWVSVHHVNEGRGWPSDW